MLPSTPTQLELDFYVKFHLLRLLLFPSDLKSTILVTLRETQHSTFNVNDKLEINNRGSKT